MNFLEIKDVESEGYYYINPSQIVDIEFLSDDDEVEDDYVILSMSNGRTYKIKSEYPNMIFDKIDECID